MTNARLTGHWLLLAFACASAAAPAGWAADPRQESQAQESDAVAESAESDSTEPDRFAQFESMLSGSKFVGQFTVTGQGERQPREEEYTIKSVKKLPRGDYWLFTARIKYGSHDLTLPLPPLEVKWAGDTPMITLTDFTIPLLGTFSSRVIIYNEKYAGTWTHGKVGGHLFGVIEKPAADEPVEEPADEETDD